MRVKCKNCKIFKEGICSHFGRKRSAGRKRECYWFDARPPKKKIKARYVPYISKQERNKIKKQQIKDMKKQNEMRKILEQQKLFEVASSGVVSSSKGFSSSSKIKKPGVFQRFFGRQKVV